MPFEIRDAGEVNVALIVFADVVMTRESLVLRNGCRDRTARIGSQHHIKILSGAKEIQFRSQKPNSR